MQKKFINKIDRYIIKQFLGTYFFAIFLILAVAIVFDITEKLDKLLQPEVSLASIIVEYYFNFVPYYANLFSPLFVFIAVIFFTTKLTQNSEITAILASGVSFTRLMHPYMISATIIALLSFLLSSFVIPPGNKIRHDFENRYIKDKKVTYGERIQMQLSSGEFIFFSQYSATNKTGYEFSMERFDGKDLRARVTAQTIEYDTLNNWRMNDYVITRFGARYDTVQKGSVCDTIIPITPDEFLFSQGDMESLTTPQLSQLISLQQKRGTPTALYEIELHKRYASIWASFILTTIGISLSTRKRKGGMGLYLAIGLGLSFAYIIFLTVSTSFAVQGSLSPMLACWLPNITYLVIAFFLYRRAR